MLLPQLAAIRAIGFATKAGIGMSTEAVSHPSQPAAQFYRAPPADFHHAPPAQRRSFAAPVLLLVAAAILATVGVIDANTPPLPSATGVSAPLPPPRAGHPDAARGESAASAPKARADQPVLDPATLEARKAAFFERILPIAERENARLLALRERVERGILSAGLAERYGVADSDRAELLRRLDAVPLSLIVAQAAHVGAWSEEGRHYVAKVIRVIRHNRLDDLDRPADDPARPI